MGPICFPVVSHDKDSIALITPLFDEVYHIFYYRPKRSCGKIMFLHVSVILSTGGGVWQPPSRQTPFRADPSPQPDTPPEMATAADGTHPTGIHSCYIYFPVKDDSKMYKGTHL